MMNIDESTKDISAENSEKDSFRDRIATVDEKRKKKLGICP